MRSTRDLAAQDSDNALANPPPAASIRTSDRRGRIMRQMLIAAAIAAGLVALWAALAPLIA